MSEADVTRLHPVEASNLRALPGIRHGYFTRHGGVSTGIYASLNCGVGSKDDPALALENRARVARHLGAASAEVVTLYQVHSNVAQAVSASIPRDNLPKSDAVVTATAGLAIGVLTADCAPVLLADPKARIVAAAHAGWRGAVGGVVEAAVAAMERLGARRQDISAAVGPCIGVAAYEVGPDFEAAVAQADPEGSAFFTREFGPKAHFDLSAYVAARLERLNLASVAVAAPCTFENESEFFSFRRSQRLGEADYGRQISAIVVT